MFLVADIYQYIVNYINDINDFLNFRQINKLINEKIYNVYFTINGAYPFMISTNTKLRKNGRIYQNFEHVISLTCSYKKNSDILNRLINLKYLNLSSVLDISYNKNIYNLPNLTYLNTGCISFDSNSLLLCKNLETLISNRSYLLNSLFVNINKLKHLECELSIELTDKCLTNLTNLIYFRPPYINNFTVEGLQKLTNLEILHNTKNCYMKYNILIKLTKLKILELNGDSKVTNNFFLLNFNDLEELYCSNDCILLNSNNTYHMTKLKKLYCISMTLTNQVIINMTALTELSLGNCTGIDDEGIINSKKVELINLGRTKITDNGLIKLTNLTSLFVNLNYNITDLSLKKLTNLTTLDIGYNTKITDNGVKSLLGLKNLFCSHNINITDVSLLCLSNLEYLHCGCNINFRVLGLSYSKKLKEIDYTSFNTTYYRYMYFIKVVELVNKMIK